MRQGKAAGASRKPQEGTDPPVLFLDIDGVLLSDRTWALPGNQAVLEESRAGRLTRVQAASRVTFDATAVALVNRLCTKAAARIVILSNWRRTVGISETRDKLIEQGIGADLFHKDYACRFRGFSSEKWHDFRWWFEDRHPLPKYHVIIEDEDPAGYGGWPQFPIARCNPLDGLTVSAYRVALGHLRGVDEAMGVPAVSDEDRGRVIEAFRDDFAASRWLHGPDAEGLTPAIRLAHEAPQGLAFGVGHASTDRWQAERRERVWATLPRRRVRTRAGSPTATP